MPVVPFAFGASAADWSSTPEGVVREFQREYLLWNNRAVDRSRTVEGIASLKEAEREYGELLQKFCLPSFKGEPIAFGTDPLHEPSEMVQVVDVRGDKSTVRTTRQDWGSYVYKYSYELVRANGRWYLEQVYLVDEEGSYPSL